jgi:hypothetical protein
LSFGGADAGWLDGRHIWRCTDANGAPDQACIARIGIIGLIQAVTA